MKFIKKPLKIEVSYCYFCYLKKSSLKIHLTNIFNTFISILNFLLLKLKSTINKTCFFIDFLINFLKLWNFRTHGKSKCT